MNAQNRAHAAYASPVAAYRSARDTEYRLLARITSRLRHALQAGDADFSTLATALFENRNVWIAFAIDLASPENGLPEVLRGQLLSLAQYVVRQTDMVLGNQADASVLVDINLSVMRGLSGQADLNHEVTG